MAIEVALSAQEEIAAWVRGAFCRKGVYKKLERSYIVERILSAVSNAGDDSFVYRSSGDMLYDMGFEKELLEYKGEDNSIEFTLWGGDLPSERLL